MEENTNEAVNQLRYLQSIYTQEYEAVLNDLSNYTLAYNAIERNIEVLEKLNILEGANVLLNLEAGTYVEAKVSNIKNAMTYVGSGYLVEKSVEDAKEFLSSSAKRQEGLLKQIAEQKNKIEKELINIAFELESI
jgi:prefoldin alpha subunit